MNTDSLFRQSLIEWYPIESGCKALLVNGEGSALDELLEKKGSLTAISDYSGLKAAQDKAYDLVVMYDLYGFCLKCEVEVADMVSVLLSCKKEEGAVLLAMENKLGMKYWAGCQEEQEGGYFVGMEDYAGWKIAPLSKGELCNIFDSIECQYRFFYPYPDYKYPVTIYTDDCLPKVGELVRGNRNIDRDRYVIFDERRGFDSVIKAGLFPEFSNSFLVELR